MANGQRGWKAQPLGIRIRLGGWPTMGINRPPLPAAPGIEASSPRV
jgi:hypothetical protein